MMEQKFRGQYFYQRDQICTFNKQFYKKYKFHVQAEVVINYKNLINSYDQDYQNIEILEKKLNKYFTQSIINKQNSIFEAQNFQNQQQKYFESSDYLNNSRNINEQNNNTGLRHELVMQQVSITSSSIYLNDQFNKTKGAFKFTNDQFHNTNEFMNQTRSETRKRWDQIDKTILLIHKINTTGQSQRNTPKVFSQKIQNQQNIIANQQLCQSFPFSEHKKCQSLKFSKQF